MTIHIHSPKKTYFVRYHYRGHRRYEVDEKRYANSDQAARRMVKLFIQHDRRGNRPNLYEVVFVSDYYEPSILLELRRR